MKRAKTLKCNMCGQFIKSSELLAHTRSCLEQMIGESDSNVADSGNSSKRSLSPV